MKRVEGSRAQIQQGQKIETREDFPVRGGTLTTSRLICPSVTPCRCSQIAPMCQESWKGVLNSLRCQAALTNAFRLLLSLCPSNALSDGNESRSYILEELQFLRGQFVEIKDRLDLLSFFDGETVQFSERTIHEQFTGFHLIAHFREAAFFSTHDSDEKIGKLPTVEGIVTDVAGEADGAGRTS